MAGRIDPYAFTNAFNAERDRGQRNRLFQAEQEQQVLENSRANEQMQMRRDEFSTQQRTAEANRTRQTEEAKNQSIQRVAGIAQQALKMPPQGRKQFLQRAAQMYGNDFTAAGADLNDIPALIQQDDMDLENDLKEVAAFGPQQEPQQPRYTQPVAGVGPDGKPQYRRFSDNDPNGTIVPDFQPTPPQPRSGMRVQSDGAGGFSLYEGPEAAGVDLTNPTKNKLQEGAVNAQSGIDRLAGIRQGFDPRWLTYKEQFKQSLNSVRAKASGLPFVSSLSPQEQTDLSAFSRFKSDTTDNLNRYITEITGAAMGVQEAKRIISTMPSLEDDPSSFQSKLDQVEERLRLVLARSVYTQRNGIKFDAVPIEQMKAIMNQRGDEIYRQNLAATRDPAAAKQATVQALNAEFFQ